MSAIGREKWEAKGLRVILGLSAVVSGSLLIADSLLPAGTNPSSLHTVYFLRGATAAFVTVYVVATVYYLIGSFRDRKNAQVSQPIGENLQ